MSIQISTQFDRENIDHTADYEGHLMVSLHGKDASFERTPINAVLVLDMSGSMSGRKLDLLKETATKLVQNLTSSDKISIVTYASDVKVDLANTQVGNKESILTTIDSMYTRGMTNMSGGILEGFNQVDESFNGVQRVMVLTDGIANVGISDYQGLVELVKNRDSKCTLSTFAFGDDAEEELLQNMAKVGGGNYYYIKDSDISDVFANELGGIASCLAQNIEISLDPAGKNEVVKVLNDYNVKNDNGIAIISADDIYADEQKHVLVKMKLAKPNGKTKDRPVSIAKIKIAYDDLKTGKREVQNLSQKVKFVKPEKADKETALAVEEQTVALEAAQVQIDAVELANSGDFFGAKNLVTRFTQNRVADTVERGSDFAAETDAVLAACVDGLDSSRYNRSFGNAVIGGARAYSRMKAGSGDSAIGSMGKMKQVRSQAQMVQEFNSPKTIQRSPDPQKQEKEPKQRKSFEKSKTRKT